MKGKRGGASTKVMLALLAVLLVSLGFLSSQGREGLTMVKCEGGKRMNTEGKCE